MFCMKMQRDFISKLKTYINALKEIRMRALIIMILWTWGLTPLWVNIVGTCLMVFNWFAAVGKAAREQSDE